ncbi:hypothetical protein N3K66_002682 [Trichothecium roseum]|uniref:Uncharacterized protein n=1 Tax=Trichothecium roseum TaxID=47278 RepID=A0ACC0VBX3_9HYPO|nr:hypothetical protein N3K66_002682 [Trichothecium roseum]
MAPGQVTIDFSDDFDVTPSTAQPAATTAQRNLLLAPPSIAAHEEKLRDVFTTYDRFSSDLQMLDRLSAGLVSLPPATYDLVLVLTDNDSTRRSEALKLLTRDVYTALVPSMKPGAKLRLQDGSLGATEAREAILAGLVEKDGAHEKVEEEEVVVPLRFGAKKKANGVNGTTNGGAVSLPKKQINLDDVGSDDEIIDENELLTADDLKRPIQIPPECQPKPGKRRRPCKDCTCGLAEKMNAEDAERQDQATKDLNVLKLQSDDLYDELDFTVQGKTGSCNSCSLGDAFRCATCPYIGLPPFKPGEEVSILNNTVQL